MPIKHAKTSGLPADEGNSAHVEPTDWYADHTGGYALLASQTASSSAQLDFTTFISSTYDVYEFVLVGVVPATNNVDFYIRFSTAGTFDTGTNYVNNNYLQATSGNVSANGTADTTFAVRRNGEINNTAQYGLAGRLTMFAPQSTTLGKRIFGNVVWTGASPNWVNSMMDGYYKNPTVAVDGVRFLFSAGNIASGSIRVYGIPKT